MYGEIQGVLCILTCGTREWALFLVLTVFEFDVTWARLIFSKPLTLLHGESRCLKRSVSLEFDTYDKMIIPRLKFIGNYV